MKRYPHKLTWQGGQRGTFHEDPRALRIFPEKDPDEFATKTSEHKKILMTFSTKKSTHHNHGLTAIALHDTTLVRQRAHQKLFVRYEQDSVCLRALRRKKTAQSIQS